MISPYIGSNTVNSMSIGFASPEKIRSWSYGEVKKQKQSIIVRSKPERDGYFANVFSGHKKTGNVIVENINALVIKVWFVTVAGLK